MKKTLTFVLAAVLCVGALAMPATAAKKKSRVAEGRYEASLGVRPGVSPFWVGSPIGNITAVQFPTAVGENYISVEILDASGLPTAGTITADTDGNPTIQETVAEFCGKTEKPVKIPAGPIQVSVASGQCGDGVGVATSGTVKATFSNIP